MNLVERVQAILLKPRSTWPVIEGEPDDIPGLYKNYLVYLAGVSSVAAFIGLSLVGTGMMGIHIRVPILAGLANMVVGFVLTLVMIYVLALVANALAPSFGGQKDMGKAFKLVAYGATAGLLGGVFNLLPALSMLWLLAALYSIYLLYTGLPVLMKSAPEKSVAYTAVVIVAAIVMGVLVAAVGSVFMPKGGAMLGSSGGPTITMNTPGGKVSIDTAGLEAAGKKMEEAARKMEEAQKSQDPAAIAAAAGDAAKAAAGAFGGGQAIAAQSLKAALPEKLAGLPRTGFDVQDGAALGLPTSQASAQYGNDDRQVRLEIVDIGGLGQMAVMAMGMAQGEKEDQTSAEKTWQEGGRTLHQRYGKDGSHAEFKTILKNGLVVSIEGDNMDIKSVRGLLS